MAKKKLFKSKTNFTLRRLHQSGSYGNIYERDYTTVVNSFSHPEGQIPIYNSPSFKMSISAGFNGQKKYKYGNWLINDNTCATNKNSWTLNCMPDGNTKSREIILKPNSKKITDFACYGSAYDLIKSSLLNIISKYPAELYVTNTTFKASGLKDTGSLYELSELFIQNKYDDCYIVENPLFIDIIQKIALDDASMDVLRYLCFSKDDYNIIDGDNNVIDVNREHFWYVEYNEAQKTDTECLNNGDLLSVVNFDGKINDNSNELVPLFKIYCFFYENDILYLIDAKTREGKDTNGWKIRPNKDRINEFFKNLNDFEKNLLNESTEYTAIFETYNENENGWFVNEKKYKWPVDNGGWNITTKGLLYNQYIDDLSKLAITYDNFFTDAIWRTMTHESISNMDLTAMVLDNDSNSEILNSSKLKQMLSIVGRQFDEIKKYADNIKNTNIVSYDQSNNIPDYFLSDTLNLCGWETKEILSLAPENILTKPMYSNRSIGFNCNDANNEFLRRLKLNSKNIFSMKGTKRAIEDLLAIFGFHSTNWLKRYYGNELYRKSMDNSFHKSKFRKSYTLIEYVYVANGYYYPSNIENNEDDENFNETICNNVKRINELKDSYSIDGIENTDFIFDPYQGIPVAEATDENGKTRIVPWFDKNLTYDTKIYFQNNGGWSRNDGITDNIIYVENFIDLLSLTEEDISLEKIYYSSIDKKYYKVIDVNKFQEEESWREATIEEIIGITPKYEYSISKIHFVESIDDLYVLTYAYINEGDIYYVGKENSYYKLIDINNYDNEKGWGEPTIEDFYQINNIVDNNKGNNPHTGNYDSGKSYLMAFGNFFKNSTFEGARLLDVGDTNYGFNIERQADSTKCLFFTDEERNENLSIYPLRGENNIKPYNFFGGNENSESSSLSVINSKEFHIIFDKEYKDFIEQDILPFLKQIIPSTTIFSYSFSTLGIKTDEEIFKAQSFNIICNGDICPIYGLS